jgi:threonine synthase
MTPLLLAENLGSKPGIKNLFIKDESLNPTGSFKARGLGMAVSKAKEYGVRKCAIPTAGNAGGAMAAYCAKAGIEAHVFMPENTPDVFKKECEYFGAHLTLVKGLISDCGKIVEQRKGEEGWFDVSTLREPYRIEGKKTMGYEIAEQMEWTLPDVIIYPTGGGTGLIGMWKAFDEMEQLGWIGSKRPRMIAVQSATCAPVVKAFEEGKKIMEFFSGAHTLASGLCVPKPYGDELILKVICQSNGLAVAVTDEEIIEGVKQLASAEGIFAAPEGGAVVAALYKLLDTKKISPDEKIVLLNTGSGYKYL